MFPDLCPGRPANPESVFGARFRAWKKYYEAYRNVLPREVWAALLLGRAVIPLNWRKTPLVKWKSYQTEPPTIERVLAWARQFHPAAWGVVTGRRYGFLVLDFDGPRGIQTMQRLGIRPHLRTGSGWYHAHVAYPDDLDVRSWNYKKASFLNVILPGTDIKADGGYAVFAGVNKKGAYQWLRPMWPDPCTPEIHELLARVVAASPRNANGGSRAGQVPPSSNQQSFSSNGDHYVPPNILLEWAWARAVGGRNAAGFDLACQLRDNGYAQTEAEAVVAEYVQGVGAYNQHGECEPYTLAEALASVAQAYSRSARQPWGSAEDPAAGRFSSTPHPSSSSPPGGSTSSPPSSSAPPPSGPRLVVPGGPRPDGRRQIIFEPPLTPVVEDSLEALDRHYRNAPRLFIRGNRLTEVVRDEQDRCDLRLIGEHSMTAHLDRVADYLQPTKNDLVPIFPPRLIVFQILARSADQLPFPPLVGMVRSPVMRANGTVLERATPGYDPDTRYYCAMDPAVAQLNVPDTPTPEDLAAAVAILKDLLWDFCFAEPRKVYVANYIALLLTLLMRWMIDGNLPIFAIDATKSRSGKGLLATIAGILVNGHHPITCTAPEPGESGEWRKRITSYLLGGHNLIVIDNLVFTINVAELCAMVTTRNYSDRILGGNTVMAADPTTSVWVFTGNSLQPVGDLVKRCFWIRLDPQRNDPEKRTGFRHVAYDDLLAWVATNRAALLRALLTLVRAWVVAGQPKPKGVASFGGFDRWIHVVGCCSTRAWMGFFKIPCKLMSTLMLSNGYLSCRRWVK